jgi:hypothetical protein
MEAHDYLIRGGAYPVGSLVEAQVFTIHKFVLNGIFYGEITSTVLDGRVPCCRFASTECGVVSSGREDRENTAFISQTYAVEDRRGCGDIHFTVVYVECPEDVALGDGPGVFLTTTTFDGDAERLDESRQFLSFEHLR